MPRTEPVTIQESGPGIDTAAGTRGSPRLLFVANQVSDFRQYRMALARRMQAAGFEIHVAVPPESGIDVIAGPGIFVHAIPVRRLGVSPLGELRTIIALVRLYRRLRPTLVHHICLKPMLYGGIAARFVGIPAVVDTLTGLGPLFTERSTRLRLLRSVTEMGLRLGLSRQNHRVIFQNPDDRDRLIARRIVPGEKAVLIRGSGVDLSLFRPTPEPAGSPVVLMASRLLWDKGVGEYVAAARVFRQRGLGVRFLLLGLPEEEHPCAIPRSTIERWRDAGDVEWLGWRDDMPALMAASHIVCLPSYYGEGIPRILIEAAASGRPIVTTDSAGCRETVHHGRNGLLVPVRDVEALTAALERLAGNASLRKAMGARGRAIAVQQFGLEHVLEENLAVHHSVLGIRHGSA
jgi:glycosyltransferase involved in cell wall biosynthesis